MKIISILVVENDEIKDNVSDFYKEEEKHAEEYFIQQIRKHIPTVSIKEIEKILEHGEFDLSDTVKMVYAEREVAPNYKLI